MDLVDAHEEAIEENGGIPNKENRGTRQLLYGLGSAMEQLETRDENQPADSTRSQDRR